MVDAVTDAAGNAGRPVDSRDLAADLRQTSTNPVDFAFLVTQTFGDTALEREILDLFVAQAGTILRDLPGLPYRQQSDLAHRLKGSARGIGACALAAAADGYEQAEAGARPDAFRALETAVGEVLAAIAGRSAAEKH